MKSRMPNDHVVLLGHRSLARVCSMRDHQLLLEYHQYVYIFLSLFHSRLYEHYTRFQITCIQHLQLPSQYPRTHPRLLYGHNPTPPNPRSFAHSNIPYHLYHNLSRAHRPPLIFNHWPLVHVCVHVLIFDNVRRPLISSIHQFQQMAIPSLPRLRTAVFRGGSLWFAILLITVFVI